MSGRSRDHKSHTATYASHSVVPIKIVSNAHSPLLPAAFPELHIMKLSEPPVQIQQVLGGP